MSSILFACSGGTNYVGGESSSSGTVADVSDAITADTLGIPSGGVIVTATSNNTSVAKVTDEVYDSADIVTLDARSAVSYLKSFKITAVGPGKTYIDVKTKVVSTGTESHKYIPVTVKDGKLSEKTAAAIKSVVTETEPSSGSSSETSYTITISDSITNGTVTAKIGTTEVTEAKAGEEITLTVTPSDGYAPDTLTVKDAGGADVTVTANKFTMPAKNVTVSAVFKVATVTYSVTVDGAITGGTVGSDKTTDISSGSTVTLTITRDGGKVLDALTVKDASNNAVTTTAVVAGTSYTFTMPESNVTVTATFADPYSTGLVGDIVLSDGKYITATNYEKYSEQLTQTAVAVIFDVSGSNKKGVGLVGTKLAWAKKNTTGWNKKFDTSDTDGSGNWGVIATADATGAADAETNYPAFNFANTYGVSVAGEESGWYLPAKDELASLRESYKASGSAVKEALDKCTGTIDLSTGWYWSSSQSTPADGGSWIVNFGTDDFMASTRQYTNSVCAVRAF